MKTLMIVLVLLAQASSAHASKFRESDRKWLPVVDQWAKAGWTCYKDGGREGEKDAKPRIVKACKTLEAAENKLVANGYCVIRETIGRPSKDRKQCDPIDWP